MDSRSLRTTCCIAGGGPAGIMLGFLLARSGIEVTVLEMWPDFFRDFRGDTIHPSTMQVLRELGLYEKFLALPHNETKHVAIHIGDTELRVADFTHLKSVPPFLGFIPQWDLLNFLAEEAKKYSSFHLLMKTKATDLITEGERVVGVQAEDAQGKFEIHATSSSEPMVATQPLARSPASRSKISARRLMSCGSVSRARTMGSRIRSAM